MISHVEQWVYNGKNLANNSIHFLATVPLLGAPVLLLGAIVGNQGSISLYPMIAKKLHAIVCCFVLEMCHVATAATALST